MNMVSRLALLTFVILIQSCFSPKYKLDVGKDEERGIRDTSTGDLIVPPAVIGFVNEKEHYFGYRLPKQDVLCERKNNEQINTFTIAKLDLKPIYYSLSLESGSLREFMERAKFEKHLKSLGIELGDRFLAIENSPFVLHYKKIYKDYDLSGCSPV